MEKAPDGHRTRAASAAVFPAAIIGALLGFGVFCDHVASFAAPQSNAVAALHADLARDYASAEVLDVAHWAIDSGDHSGLPFVVVDKPRARLFVFDASGRLRGSTPVLLSAVWGDGPAAPATPAGRFAVDTWLSALGEGMVLANSEATVSLQSALATTAPGRAERRLASGAIEDRRISNGTMHVADEFYRKHIDVLRQQAGIAYVLPEAGPFNENGLGKPPARKREQLAQAGIGL